jgi:hypothetical protein
MTIGNSNRIEKNINTTLIAGDFTNALNRKAKASNVAIYNHENRSDLKKSAVNDSEPYIDITSSPTAR